MDMSRYDPAEVKRFSADAGEDWAIMRFAMHVEKRCPTHVWPHMVFAKFSAEPEERAYHLERAVRAGNNQLEAEAAGVSTRSRDGFEGKLFRMALYTHGHQFAKIGLPGEAARSVAQLLELDPADEADVAGMARVMGIFPAAATEAAANVRM